MWKKVKSLEPLTVSAKTALSYMFDGILNKYASISQSVFTCSKLTIETLLGSVNI